MLLLVGWFILLALSWPLALLVFVLAPIVWLVALPFCLLGLVVGAMFALLKSLLYLPARLFGYR
jgi:hypothetical protein